MLVKKSIRMTIIDDVVETLGQYNLSFIEFSDVGGTPAIYRGKQAFDGDVDPPPIITVLPLPETTEHVYSGTRCIMPIDIVLIVRLPEDDLDAWTKQSDIAELCFAQLVYIAFKDVPENAQQMIYISGGIEEYPTSLKEPLIKIRITIEITYITDVGDPYTFTI